MSVASVFDNTGSTSRQPPFRVVMIPSVSGGIGHISRTAALAGALRHLDPTVEVEYLLDAEKLRPFNIDATRRMGFRPRFLPPRTRDNRDALVRACLDQADVVVDDCTRYLLPLRQAVPHVGWITLAMHPLGDELFMDWPLIAQMDAVIWPYAPLVELPAELKALSVKVVQTGPFLEPNDVPGKAASRTQLRLPESEPFILYAPRGFPFGREFGHRAFAAIFAAVEALRCNSYAELKLVLLAVSDPTELHGIPGVPDRLPDWVVVKGVVTPAEALLFTRATDAVIGEGTSTMHEGAALRTPLVLLPGPIPEATLLAQALARERAGTLILPEQTTGAAFAAAFLAALTPSPEQAGMLDRAHALITGGGGAISAARIVLDIASRRRAGRDKLADLPVAGLQDS